MCFASDLNEAVNDTYVVDIVTRVVLKGFQLKELSLCIAPQESFHLIAAVKVQFFTQIRSYLLCFSPNSV